MREFAAFDERARFGAWRCFDAYRQNGQRSNGGREFNATREDFHFVGLITVFGRFIALGDDLDMNEGISVFVVVIQDVILRTLFSSASVIFQLSYSSSLGFNLLSTASSSNGSRVMRCIGNIKKECRLNPTHTENTKINLNSIDVVVNIR